MKKKLIGIIFTTALCISALSFGIYAAFNVTHNSSGTITFNTLEADVDLDITVTGATINPPKFIGTTNQTRQPDKPLITSSTWNFGNLVFDDINAVSPDELEIKFEMKISNYSRFPIKANITVPSIAGLTITKQELDFSYSYESSLGADERTLEVIIVPISEQVTSANLDISLNISKTLKKETNISKFIWSTPSNGTISITGSNLSSSDKQIIIPRKNGSNKVTGLGNDAFYNKIYITRVIMSNGITRVGDRAFQGCSALTSVLIGNDVTSIGSTAFYNCSALTKLTLPNSLISIGESAFYGTAWYNSQPDGIVYAGKVLYTYKGTCPTVIDNIKSDTLAIANYAFKNCIFTSITLPNSITNIGSGAFYYCTRLTSITIPDSVISMGNSVFSSCSSLASITISNYVTSIGSNAFYQCSSLTSITIPYRVTSIGDYAFDRCSKLTTINVYPLNAKYSSNNGVLLNKNKTSVVLCPPGKTTYTIPSTVTSISDKAFYRCEALTSITIPSSVKSIGYRAFDSCIKLTEINIPSGVTSIGDYAFSSCSTISSVIIPDTVNSIGMDAFNGTAWYKNQIDGIVYAGKVLYKYKGTCPSVINNIKSDTLGIAGNAFNSCSALISITIPNNVLNIGDFAFSSCSALTSITIPNSVINIGDSAFNRCSALTSLSLGSGVESIGNYAFEDCSTLTSINMSNSIISIGDYAFNDCRALTGIIIPNSVTSIGVSAFESCIALTNIIIPNSVKVIERNTFKSCSKLSNIMIGSGVTNIDNSAFDYCSNLAEINVNDANQVYSSDNGVLLNKNKSEIILCPGGKTSYIIPKTITNINNSAFSFRINLTSLMVDPGNSTYCSEEGILFNKDKTTILLSLQNITSYVIPDSVINISDYAFSGCEGLTSIAIPSGVSSIGEAAFANCHMLDDVYFDRTIPFIYLGGGCFGGLRYGSILSFRSKVVMDQFVYDVHFSAELTYCTLI